MGNQHRPVRPGSWPLTDQYTAKPLYIANAIKQTLLQVGEDRGIEYDDERISAAVKSLLDITTQYSQKSDWYQPIREVLLYDMNIPIEYITSHYYGQYLCYLLCRIFTGPPTKPSCWPSASPSPR